MNNPAVEHIKRRVESLKKNPPQTDSEYKAAYKQAMDDLEVVLMSYDDACLIHQKTQGAQKAG